MGNLLNGENSKIDPTVYLPASLRFGTVVETQHGPYATVHPVRLGEKISYEYVYELLNLAQGQKIDIDSRQEPTLLSTELVDSLKPMIVPGKVYQGASTGDLMDIEGEYRRRYKDDSKNNFHSYISGAGGIVFEMTTSLGGIVDYSDCHIGRDGQVISTGNLLKNNNDSYCRFRMYGMHPTGLLAWNLLSEDDNGKAKSYLHMYFYRNSKDSRFVLQPYSALRYEIGNYSPFPEEPGGIIQEMLPADRQYLLDVISSYDQQARTLAHRILDV